MNVLRNCIELGLEIPVKKFGIRRNYSENKQTKEIPIRNENTAPEKSIGNTINKVGPLYVQFYNTAICV